MKLLVTGASGFLGRYVVAEALRRGHAVRAMTRAPGGAEAARAKFGWPAGELEVVRADLRSRKGLADAVRGVDAVLHLAAAKAGDVYEQYAGTVVATENLLWAMGEAGVSRIVHVSSFSVYDIAGTREWSVLDENSRVEKDAFERDGYAHTKLVQERLVIEAAKAADWKYVVLRPGVIFGKDNLWNALIGMQAGRRLWVRTGAWSPTPLTYVENCAEAVVLSAEKVEQASGQVLNVVDDESPSHRRYMNLLRKRTSPRPLVLPVSWTVMRCLARAAWLTNKLLLGNRAKIPSILVPCRLAARVKPLRYTNKKVKQVLGWAPRHGLVESIDRSLADASAPSSPSPGTPGEGRGEGLPQSAISDSNSRNIADPHPSPRPEYRERGPEAGTTAEFRGRAEEAVAR